MSRTMGAVRLENIWKSFGHVEALKGIDLPFESGDLTVLLGHSGAGKTTILRMIAGLETVDRGDIRINGRVVNDEPPRSRGTSMAFESYALYPQLSVFENMAFSFLVAAGAKWTLTEEVRGRVRAMAELLEIAQLLDRLPRQLSGGQRQRVALGRTLVRDAAVHLLDEPIAHLDAKLRHQLRGGLKHLQRDRGATTVWTTPDQLEAMSIADQVVVMNHGVLEQSGPPSELYQHPKNEYVARSLGEPPMNILSSSVRRADDEMQLDINGTSLPVRGEGARVLEQSNGDGRISMGIRPTDISVQAERPREPSLESEVVVFEPLGQYGVVTAQCAGEELKVKVGKGIRPEPGARIWLVPHAERYHFFNPRTGEALRA